MIDVLQLSWSWVVLGAVSLEPGLAMMDGFGAASNVTEAVVVAVAPKAGFAIEDVVCLGPGFLPAPPSTQTMWEGVGGASAG